MINKPEKSKRKYVPISIAESLKNINRKFLYKFGKLDYTIHSKWTEIVGSFFVNYSEPLKISSILSSVDENGSNIYERYLHVNVSPAAAIEFQHFQDKIVEKVNSYFGYKAIKGIKIHQQYIKNNMNSLSYDKEATENVVSSSSFMEKFLSSLKQKMKME